jgi:hypothetical protein
MTNNIVPEGYSIEEVLISPLLANEFLAKNHPGNRPLTQAQVKRLTQAILNGEFVVGDAIKFNCLDQLIDGQHRLSAIVKANKSVTMLVIRGYGDHAMSVLDIGTKRSVADIAKLSGSSVNTKHLSIARAILLPHKDTAKYRVITHKKLIEITETLITYINFGLQSVTAKNTTCRSVVQGAIARAFYCGENSDRLNEFGRIYSDGICAKECDTAALRLREFFLSNKGIVRDRVDEFSYAQSAIDSFLKYKKRAKIGKVTGIIHRIDLDKSFG